LSRLGWHLCRLRWFVLLPIAHALSLTPISSFACFLSWATVGLLA
jgi:hypothetical protein